VRSGLGSYSTAFLCAITESITSAMLRRQPNDHVVGLVHHHGQQDRLHGYFRKYGPSARTLYMLYDGKRTPAELDDVINNALDGINIDGLRKLIHEAKGRIRLGQSNISHSVILVYPDPKNRSNMLVDVISRHVCMLLADELYKQGINELVRTYRLFRDIDPLSVGAGWMFEYYCHRMLSEHENREIQPVPLANVTLSAEASPSSSAIH
jgi:hypothetical protein